MGVIGRVAIFGAAVALLVAVIIGGVWYKLSIPAPRPDIQPRYWGPGRAKADDPTIRPYKISVSDKTLEDLRQRLKSVPSLTAPLEDANFNYGFSSDFLQKVVQFWLNDYNWREREVYLNSLPQYKTQVAGLQIHFIHAKPTKVPEGVTVLPLLLLHGWPGSVREFYELIPLLTTPRPGANFVFEVVAPSLVGYGFSEGSAKKGLSASQMSVVFKSLMERLNFKQFYVQGGDWGAAIGSSLSTLFPESVKGYHANLCFAFTPVSQFKMFLGSFCPSLVVDKEHAHKVYPIGSVISYLIEESGYMHLQATKPDTLGVALRDSPVGLAAYILEKFSTWTNKEWKNLPDGGLLKKYTLTNLLDNIMIYWVTGSITTSVRLYSEQWTYAEISLNLDSVPCTVPTAIANFPNELAYTPESLARDKFVNLVHFSHMAAGGHFAAFEEPQLLADDIWTGIGKIRKFQK